MSRRSRIAVRRVVAAFKLRRSGGRRGAVDDAVAAYEAWTDECVAVRATYRIWRAAGASLERLALDEYWAALDREERAAAEYARRVHHAQKLAETGVALEPAQYPTWFGM